MIGLALFVYIRSEHAKRVIESIKRNHFEKIYVFQDGLKNEMDREGWEKVSELIKGIDFAETEIHIDRKNKGLANSIVMGMDYVFKRHEVAIALEDDVVLADGFKDLAEVLFKKYAENKRIMSICGAGSGVIVPKDYMYDVYFSYRMSSVAFGTWKDRWDGFERNPAMLREIYSDSDKKEMLKNAGNDTEKMLFASLQRKNDTWATYWELYQINCLGYHVIPVKGYAVDIGRDGSGTNTVAKISRYDIELDGKKKDKYELPDGILLDENIVNDTKRLMDVPDCKFQCYFEILCKWMKLYQKTLSTMSFFEAKNISRIYIYGTGNLAEFLYNDISEYVEISGFIVESRKSEEYKGKKVFDMEHCDNLDNIPIVITPSYDLMLIGHLFEKHRIENRIILIEDVVGYVLNKEEKRYDREC